MHPDAAHPRVVAIVHDALRGVRPRHNHRAANPAPVRTEVLLTPDIFAPSFAAEAIRGADVVITAVGPNFASCSTVSTKTSAPE